MTVAVFLLSLLGAMAIGMPMAYALLICGLALMGFMAATGALPAFDSQILALKKQIAESKIPNIDTVLATETDCKLPAESVDLALFVDVYHELL
ncbi:MAG: hypothetical protein ACO241_12075, partial [Burkholderiaceae bacterium]